MRKSHTLPERVTAPLKASTINPPNISGLAACTEDARQSALDGDTGPAEPNEFHSLRGRLEAVRAKLPPLYRDAFVNPYIRSLDQLGPQGFNRILVRDPNRESIAGLMLDLAQAILQQGEGFAEQATDAFQEVVSDLYDGFLSAEDRKGVNPPDAGVIPPLVKWGNPDFGPYTWPVDATTSFGVKAAAVSLPPANARKGLLAWSALGHETAGHDILHADAGLQDQLARALQQSLAPLGHGLDEYWSERIDETSSDVMGILNMGYAAGIGLIAYFRGLNFAFGGSAKLRNQGSDSDPHPADIVRGYLAAETVALLKFTGRKGWAKTIADETDKDVTSIVLAGEAISQDLARKSARVVAETLVTFKAPALENHALGEIQNWRDADERKVQIVRQALRTATPASSLVSSGLYAAHVVAAAVVEALSDGTALATIFDRMLTILKTLHNENASWGPLFISHPGNIVRDFVYDPKRRLAATDEVKLTEEFEPEAEEEEEPFAVTPRKKLAMP